MVGTRPRARFPPCACWIYLDGETDIIFPCEGKGSRSIRDRGIAARKPAAAGRSKERTMSSLIVEISKIQQVLPHPNAQRLELAHVKGWQCVVPKGKYAAGNLIT